MANERQPQTRKGKEPQPTAIVERQRVGETPQQQEKQADQPPRAATLQGGNLRSHTNVDEEIYHSQLFFGTEGSANALNIQDARQQSLQESQRSI
ncbi:MAG: hypothetical protein V3V61_02650 [Gammaproteobacteria bacterium]